MRCILAGVALALLGAAPSATPRLLGVDHIPVAVSDLEAAKARFRALGFVLKPGRFHANGITNAHAKFADGSSIELITAAAARDDLTRRYRAYLAQGDGPAFLAFYVSTTQSLLDRLAGLGAIADGNSAEFAQGPLAPFFFGTRQRAQNDRPEHFAHGNGAIGVSHIWLAPGDPRPVLRMTERLGARYRSATLCLPRCTRVRIARLASGTIVLFGGAHQRLEGRPIIGATIRVRSLAAARNALGAGGVPVRADRNGLFVSPEHANGMWLHFSER